MRRVENRYLHWSKTNNQDNLELPTTTYYYLATSPEYVKKISARLTQVLETQKRRALPLKFYNEKNLSDSSTTLDKRNFNTKTKFRLITFTKAEAKSVNRFSSLSYTELGTLYTSKILFVIKWSRNIAKKINWTFVQFDAVDLYPSITKPFLFNDLKCVNTISLISDFDTKSSCMPRNSFCSQKILSFEKMGRNSWI